MHIFKHAQVSRTVLGVCGMLCCKYQDLQRVCLSCTQALSCGCSPVGSVVMSMILLTFCLW
jgi:hypothetical protein